MGLGRTQAGGLIGRLCRLPAELVRTAFYVGVSMGRLVLFPSHRENDDDAAE